MLTWKTPKVLNTAKVLYGGQNLGPSQATTTKDYIQGKYRALKKAYQTVELPSDYTFHDSGVGSINAKDKWTYQVLKMQVDMLRYSLNWLVQYKQARSQKVI